MKDPVLSATALAILKKRYLQPNETPAQLFWRVAWAVAEPEGKNRQEWAEKFYELMISGKALPNSPTLASAGLPNRGGLSACYVLSPQDTMVSILDTMKQWGLVEKWGGGVGMGLSKIRPKGDKIATTHGVALGPVAIMRMYSAMSNEITQGSFRRGAHMAQLNCSHPDIFEFISCKDTSNILSNFNISVQVTDDFVEEVLLNGKWSLRNPRTDGVVRTFPAKELWDSLCLSAWKTGDPGVVFIDRVWETQPNPQLGFIEGGNPCLGGSTRLATKSGLLTIAELSQRPMFEVLSQDGQYHPSHAWKTGRKLVYRVQFRSGVSLVATADHKVFVGGRDVCVADLMENCKTEVESVEFAGEEDVYDFSEPVTNHAWAGGVFVHNCGEQNLENYGSCNLASLNVGKYVPNGMFLEEDFSRDVHTMVRFLDNVVEINTFPLPEIREMNLKTRRVGLGIMGLADALVMLGIPYSSQEAITFSGSLAKQLTEGAWGASHILAQERGVFSEFPRSHLAKSLPVRNSCVTSIAPTGTISRIAGCSAGIEPYFSLAWWSNILWEDQNGTSQKFLDAPAPLWQQLERRYGEEKAGAILKKIADNPEDGARVLAEYKVDPTLYETAHGLSYKTHIKMQAEWQIYITNGVSKSTNMPFSAMPEDVSNAFLMAWKTGCKSTTIYRDGSKSMQVLETGQTRLNRDQRNVSSCPECKTQLVEQEGCISCLSCGYGKCQT